MIDPQPGTGAASTAYRRLVDNVRRVIAGNDAAVEMAALCVFADGNLLLEGVPGVGKTTLARSLAVSIGGAFSRIQATPDLLPSDLTGVSVYDQREGSFRFMPGPVFANVVLVDEINRTPPRTQAALLEPMEERQVTVEGSTHPLPEPYVVIATENPIEQHGTYPLPEGQLDRFALSVRVGYPDDERSGAVVRRQLERHPLARPRAGDQPRGGGRRAARRSRRVRGRRGRAIRGRAGDGDADGARRGARRVAPLVGGPRALRAGARDRARPATMPCPTT